MSSLLDWHYLVMLVAPLGAFGVFLLTPWGAPVLALLLRSRILQGVVVTVVAGLWIAAARRKSYDAGQAKAYRDLEIANKRAVELRRQAEIEIATRSGATNRERLKRWSR